MKKIIKGESASTELEWSQERGKRRQKVKLFGERGREKEREEGGGGCEIVEC